MTLRTLQAAGEELTAAVEWYERQQPGLGGEFFDAVARTIDHIQTHPEMGTSTRSAQHTRRILLARFPYQIVYRLRPGEIVIVAVAHMRRRPGYWKHRA